jgi:protein disulfide-isomerase A1
LINELTALVTMSVNAAYLQVMGFHMEKNKKFKYTGELTEAALSAFATSVLDDTAQADFKSASIPEEPEDGGVTVVVGKNFDDIVMDQSKDVLLEVLPSPS